MARRTCVFRLVFAILSAIVALRGVPARAQEGRAVHVANVAELYAAVNDPDNAGRRIVVAPGTHFLDPTEPNGGRLEFQQDMDIVGQRGDSDAVVIDASNLPAESYALPEGFFTGPIRMGRGSNALEWLTIQNANPSADVGGSAAVETDLLGVGATVVRVAHVIAQRNRAGIDFRNLSTMMDGRILHAIAEDNVLRENTAGNGYGIRVINTAGVTGATLWVTLRDNHSSGNLTGIRATSTNSSGNTILIESRADHFSNNRIGCVLDAGGTTATGGVADSNVLVFEAHNDVIVDNDGDPGLELPGGINAYGGASTLALENQTSGNVLQVSLVDTRFSGNHPGSDINAFGAVNSGGVLPGKNNHVDMLLERISSDAAISIVDSDPPDPDGTNTVVVRRYGRR